MGGSDTAGPMWQLGVIPSLALGAFWETLRQEAPSGSEGMGGCNTAGPMWQLGVIPSLALGAFC